MKITALATSAISIIVIAGGTTDIVHARSPVIGALTGIDSAGIVSGWAQDPDAPSSSIAVHFYVDGPAGVGTFVATQAASIPQGAPVAGPHGFRFAIPSRLRDGAAHSLYVYGIDALNGAD
ncbi:MAG TPA: hypothetical protein VFV78_12565, partial [Vicinamibacterales bacterium]|nr:hypothetical protein [Vicinamibacterales bacterium]